MLMNETRSTRRAESRSRAAHSLARYVRARRLEIEASVAEAAELAGVEVVQWCAMEAGSWLPPNRPVQRAIADVLGVCTSQISIMTFVAAANQAHTA